MKNRYKRAFDLFFCSMFLIGLTVSASGQNMFRKMMDFDGDGKADFAVTRNIGGYKYWYIWQSTDGFRVSQWGLDTDENVPGDYDGDGKFDVATFRQIHNSTTASYTFWISGSQFGTRAVGWTTNSYPNVVGHQQDYDGDGKTEVAYTWGSSGDRTQCYIWYSTGSGNGCIPLVGPLVKLGDMTGDGKADFAGVQTSPSINVVRINTGSSVQQIFFGREGDQYVPADFDGDGIGDLVFYRESQGVWWYRSSDSTTKYLVFGTTGDVPVPADYDGDGRTDIAIWRGGSQSHFWVYGSRSDVFVIPGGIASDSVVRF